MSPEYATESKAEAFAFKWMKKHPKGVPKPIEEQLATSSLKILDRGVFFLQDQCKQKIYAYCIDKRAFPHQQKSNMNMKRFVVHGL